MLLEGSLGVPLSEVMMHLPSPLAASAAHERRREQVGKAGVSLREIREHLLATVPGLRSHGLSVSSVARLMQPLRRGTIASSRYKALVTARVPANTENITKISICTGCISQKVHCVL